MTLSGSITTGNFKVFDLSLGAGGAVVLTGPSGRFSPEWWGAAGDFDGIKGSDNVVPFTEAITAAMGAGAELHISPGRYFFSRSLILPHAQEHGGKYSVFSMTGTFGDDIGSGFKGSTLLFATGGIVQHGLNAVRYRDFQVHCLANGCPAFDWNGFVDDTILDNIVISSYNPNQPLIKGRTDSGELEKVTVKDFQWTVANGHKVPAFDLVNSSGGNSNMNLIVLRDGLVHGSDTATAPIIRMDCMASGCYQNTIENVTFEVVPAGGIEWRSIDQSLLINVSEADSGTPTSPFITLAASAAKGGQDENGVTIINPTVGVGTPILPSLLIDNTAHPYPGQFSIIGGLLPYVRARGMNGALPLAINVRTSDKTGISVLATDTNYGTGFFLNSSTGNGTVSFAGRAYLGGCVAGTDLMVDSDNSAMVRSASYNFTRADLGGYITISGGAEWTPGDYLITGLNANSAILDRSPALAGATRGTWDVNRGRVAFLRGQGGSADQFQLCSRDANGHYDWRTP